MNRASTRSAALVLRAKSKPTMVSSASSTTMVAQSPRSAAMKAPNASRPMAAALRLAPRAKPAGPGVGLEAMAFHSPVERRPRQAERQGRARDIALVDGQRAGDRAALQVVEVERCAGPPLRGQPRRRRHGFA